MPEDGRNECHIFYQSTDPAGPRCGASAAVRVGHNGRVHECLIDIGFSQRRSHAADHIVVLIAAAIYFLIRSIRVDASARKPRSGPELGSQLPTPSDTRFVIAVVAETVVIAGMVFLMLQLRLPQYVVPLVAVIVDAHFFIFIRPGDRAVHLIASTVVVLVSIVLIADAAPEPVVARGIVGCSFAVITAHYGCYFLTWRFTGTEQEKTARGRFLSEHLRSIPADSRISGVTSGADQRRT